MASSRERGSGREEASSSAAAEAAAISAALRARRVFRRLGFLVGCCVSGLESVEGASPGSPASSGIGSEASSRMSSCSFSLLVVVDPGSSSSAISRACRSFRSRSSASHSVLMPFRVFFVADFFFWVMREVRSWSSFRWRASRSSICISGVYEMW